VPFSVTVPVVDDPAVTVDGDNTSELRAATLMVNVAFLLTPNVAVIVAEVEDPTPIVLTIKVAARLPVATVTLAGTCAAELLSERVTTIPGAGAGPFSVTVPVEELPPTTEVGLKPNEPSIGGTIVKLAWALRAL
jgi:hypothetical protein